MVRAPLYALFHLQATRGTWYWAVNFSRRGKRYYRRFYEPKYGGSENALKAATAWRDARLAKVRALTVMEFCQTKRSNNTSGVPGVHYLEPARQPNGIWQARLKLSDGTFKSKSFSVLQYGDKKAYKLAVAARKDIIASTADRLYLYDPIAKTLAPKT